MSGARWLVAALAAAMALPVAAATPPQPNGRWGISLDDYPGKALRDRLAGTTRYEIAVDNTGKAQGCTIIKSSSHAILDDQACAVLMRRARFNPARDDAGTPVPGTWRHLVVWNASNVPTRRDRPAYAGYGVTVDFDRGGAVTTCKVEPLSVLSSPTPVQANKCTTMGTAAVFSELLGQPTKGLATATYRVWKESPGAGAPIATDQAVRRVLSHVVVDRTDDDAITWCEIKVPPATPLLGLTGVDLCGPQAYGVTRTGGGGRPENLVFDVIAAR